MLGLRNLLFLSASISGFAQALSSSAPTSTTASLTKTYCPQYYVTPVSPSPASYVCGASGTLSKPAEIARLCYDDLGTQMSDRDIDCYRSCSNDAKCVSYAYDSSNGNCRLYSKPIAQMGFKAGNSTQNPLSFWNLRGCYVCNQAAPPPAQPGCRATPVLKPQSQRKNFTCGVPGSFPDNTEVEGFIYWGHDITPCYRECVKRNIEGVCEGFTYYEYSDRADQLYTACEIFAKPARELGFKPDPMGATFYNLRGCYECDQPKTSTSTCTVAKAAATPM